MKDEAEKDRKKKIVKSKSKYYVCIRYTFTQVSYYVIMQKIVDVYL